MRPSLCIAIDLGTQSSKAAIINLSGELLCCHSESYAAEILTQVNNKSEGAECDPQLFTQHVVHVLKQLLSQALKLNLNIAQIESLSVTTFRNSLILLDVEFNHVYPLILWSDARKARNLPTLSWYWRIVFKFANMFYPLKSNLIEMQRRAVLNLIPELAPKVSKKIKNLSLLSGYLTFNLTGRMVDSTANIIGYLPYNYRRKKWYSRFAWQFQALKVKSSWLPKLVKTSHIIGTIKPEIFQHFTSENSAHESRIKYIASAADKNCEMLGAGCCEDGQLHLSLGSAITLNVLSKRFIGPKPLYPAYPTFDDKLYTIEIMLEKGLLLLTEFIACYRAELISALGNADDATFETGINLEEGKINGNILQAITKYIERNEITASNIRFNLHDESIQTDIKACFNVPLINQNKGDIFHYYVALIDAIVQEIDRSILILSARTSKSFTTVYVSGGGSQSHWLLYKIASKTKLTLIKAESEYAGALGVAIICAVGLGKFNNYADAVKEMLKPGVEFKL